MRPQAQGRPGARGAQSQGVREGRPRPQTQHGPHPDFCCSAGELGEHATSGLEPLAVGALLWCPGLRQGQESSIPAQPAIMGARSQDVLFQISLPGPRLRTLGETRPTPSSGGSRGRDQGIPRGRMELSGELPVVHTSWATLTKGTLVLESGNIRRTPSEASGLLWASGDRVRAEWNLAAGLTQRICALPKVGPKLRNPRAAQRGT